MHSNRALQWTAVVCAIALAGCESAGSAASAPATLALADDGGAAAAEGSGGDDESGEGEDLDGVWLASTTLETPVDGPAPPAIQIDIGRELMITDLSVVEDPLRTTWSAPDGTPGRGVWTFGHLIAEMAGGLPPGEVAMRWLREWEVEQRFGDSVAPARPLMRTMIIDPWLVRSGCPAGATTCDLDLTQAPFRLLAIVNRIDLRDAEMSGPGGSATARTRHAGEGRFVFGALGPSGERLRFTVIFEYSQVATTPAEVQAWAQRWHALGSLPFGPDYNAALEQVTQRFAGRGMAPGRPNGNAIAQIRTNEIGISPIWELREFLLSTAGLRLAPIQQTPDFSENGTQKLRNRVRSHAAAILDGTYRVPPGQLGAIGPTPTSGTIWDAPGLEGLGAARHQFSLTTCSGCHAGETGTRFLHVGTREPGVPAALSGFLTGAELPDPVSGELRTFADLDRRALDMVDVLSATLDVFPGRGRGLNGARVH